MNELNPQQAKEQAVRLALQHDQALIRCGLEIHALNKDGTAELVSKSHDYDSLWQDALSVLQEKYG